LRALGLPIHTPLPALSHIVIEIESSFNIIASRFNPEPGAAMYIDYTESQKALRRELRAYFSALMTPELREGTRGNEGGDAYKQVIRQLGKDGWLALGWPGIRRPGAQDSEQLVFFEEAQLAEVPLPFVTINTVAPALIALGSEEHKRFFLPKIAAGELHFAIGYTEPGAGTDLAALKTSAVRDGDEYVINGGKIWTSSAEAADYIWLAARTDPDAKPQHKGITIFMVDAKQPGFSFTPLYTVGGVRSNASYYDNVRVPASMIVGQLNGGWKAITSQLNHERVGLAAIGIQGWGLLQRVLAWAQSTDGGRRQAHRRPAVGAVLAGRGLCAHGSDAPDELAHGLATRHRRAGSGLRLGDQGLQHRVPDRGRQADAERDRHGRRPAPRLAGRRAERRPRGALPQVPDQHLRRRHRRGDARPHRAVRPRHVGVQPALRLLVRRCLRCLRTAPSSRRCARRTPAAGPDP
jgi:alkylation response protein AidB-like acyl-CoA dehydrogenase